MRTGHFNESYASLVALSDSKAVWLWTAAFAMALLALPLAVGNYTLSLAVMMLVAVVGAVGLNLLTGMTGLISLGQSAFIAVGAYANAILMVDYGWPVLASVPAAGLIAAVISLFVGVPRCA